MELGIAAHKSVAELGVIGRAEDEPLPAERSPTGVPSTADFLLHEVPPLIDLLCPRL